MASVEKRFEQALHYVYVETKKHVYNPSLFYQMLLRDGAVVTAKFLINAPKPSDGFTRLWEAKRMDLTVEAVVVENEVFHSLFQIDELDRARSRLNQYHYTPRRLAQ